MSTPEDLSPEQLSSTSSSVLPYGVTWDDLAASLPGYVSPGSARLSYRTRGRHQGGQPHVIMTVSYGGAGGSHREQTVFFKRNPDHAREGDAYRHLLAAGVPVPELLLRLEREQEEVLGLEFLPSVGLRAGDVDELLRAMAVLASPADAPAAVATLGAGMPQTAFERLVDDAVHRVAAEWPEHQPHRWVDLYRRALDVYGSLPRALTHGELAAQQVGHTRDGRLVIVDWATLGERARLADLASVLATVADLTGQDEQMIMDQYLVQLGATGGRPPDREAAWAELRLTRFVQEIEALPWRTGLDDPADLRRHVATIADDHRAVRIDDVV